MPQIKFTTSDTWLLLAIVYCQTGGTLRDLIATADYLNHAIISYPELTEGLERLALAGCVKEKNKKYRATLKVIKAYQRHATPRRSSAKAWAAIEKFLATHKPRALVKNKISLTPADYADAVKEYRASF